MLRFKKVSEFRPSVPGPKPHEFSPLGQPLGRHHVTPEPKRPEKDERRVFSTDLDWQERMP